MLFDQVRNDFGIGLGYEAMIFFPQIVLQFQIVLDDAVMNDDDAATAIAMRVRVFFRGTAVRGPTGVTNAVGTIDRVVSQDLFEVAQLAFGSANLQLVILVNRGNAGGVVAAIFKLPQTLDDQGYDLFVSDVSDYSTHKKSTVNSEQHKFQSPLGSPLISMCGLFSSPVVYDWVTGRCPLAPPL